MVAIGYTLMCEQRSPLDLVRDAVLAEQAGFDFSVISDHYHPWVEAQGHSGFAWSILGAIAQATERLPLMTYVTAPIIRYHPAVVAQMAATVSLLAEGRFRLGLGSGEQLNEHVVGQGYPPVDVRHEMLIEAVEIIRELWEGAYVTYHGEHFDVEGAKLFDRPASPPPLGIAVSGRQSCALAGELADLVIATELKAELIQMFQEAGGEGKPVQNAVGERFNGRLRDECHNQHRFLSLHDARTVLAGWRVDDHQVRPHGALGHRTPEAVWRQLTAEHSESLDHTTGAGQPPPL